MSNQTNVTWLFNTSEDTPPYNNPETGVMANMDNNDFVTQRDLEHLEEKTNMKIENMKTELKSELNNLDVRIDTKFANVDSKFVEINGKFETLNEKLERMFLQQKIDTANERKENIKWIIGTGLAVIGAVAAIVALF